MCERMSCWKAVAGFARSERSRSASLLRRKRAHALLHTFPLPSLHNCAPLLQVQPGLRAFIVRADRPRGPNAPHLGSFFTPTRQRHHSHANMISICYFSAGAVYGPDASACLPYRLSRPCQGSYLQVKTCRLHSVSLCAHEREKGGCHEAESKLNGSQFVGPGRGVEVDLCI